MIPLIKFLKPPTNHIPFILFLLTSPAASQTPPPPTYDNDCTRGSGFIIFALAVSIFSMAFFSLYLLHCKDASSVAGGHLSDAVPVGESRGLDPAVIGAFPTFDYSAMKAMEIGKGALECAVCINEFADDETLRLVPECGHVFHSKCIDTWLGSHATCPVCRADLTLVQAPQLGLGPSEDVAIDVAPQQGESIRQPLHARVGRSLIRSRTRGNTSGRPRWFSFLRVPPV